MNKDSIYFKRKAEEHASVQNLRKFLREFLKGGGTRVDFARKMNMSTTQLNQYLTGIYTPKRKTIEKWGKQLGVTYEEMMVADFKFISYPFEELFKPKTQRHRFSKRDRDKAFDVIIEEIVSEVGEEATEYLPRIIKIIESHKK